MNFKFIVTTALVFSILILFVSATVCDIFDSTQTPCVAAHSTTRRLYQNYSGPLYSVRRDNDQKMMDISTLVSGAANSSAQDVFCSNTECSIHIIYDQSPQNNHLNLAPPGGASKTPDKGTNAKKAPTTLYGTKVYSAYFEGGMGYRRDKTSGIAKNDEAETIYMVTSGKHYNGGCCFDYGNAETNNLDTGAGSMESVYWGNSSGWGKGQGKGPWVMADLENGLFAGQERVGPGRTIDAEYVTAMVKGDSGNHFSLKGGNAQNGKLKLLYDGPRPNGYHPMKKQGAIILGIGGDNSDWAIGTFYEGVITQGYTTDATDDLVQANINAAGYGL
jgi:hypothetical protein